MRRVSESGDADAAAASHGGHRAAGHVRNRASCDAATADGTEATDDLDRLDAALLRRRWRTVIGRPAPPALSRQWMIRILFWREQIARSGDIDAATRAALAAALTGDGKPAGDAARTVASLAPRPGAVLVREHAGVLHRVRTLDQGYAWNGQTFKSLSAVARAITGTSWNGRRFFGLDRSQDAARESAGCKSRGSRRKGHSP